MNQVYQKIAHCQVTDNVLISDVWENRKVAVMTALEEGVSEYWASQRLVLLGDSAHKVCKYPRLLLLLA